MQIYRTVNKILLISSVLFFAGMLGKCADMPSRTLSTPAETVHLQPTKQKGQALYKLETAKTTMYFFGAIHVGRADFYPFPKQIESAFAASSTLVTEIDLNKINANYMHALFEQKLMYPQPDTIEKHISDSLLKKLRSTLQTVKIPFEPVSRMRPMYAAMTFTQYKQRTLGYNEKYGVDAYFTGKAEKAGKQIVGLETTNEQIDHLASIPENAQIKYLEVVLDKAHLMNGETNKIVDAWRTGNVHGIQYQFTKIYDDYRELETVEKILLSNRNRIMADRLVPLIQSGGSFFVVVGSGHLIGNDNVLVLLAKHGYTITRL
ncbi:MAG: TraB/GumN family protein [Spirochaetales bacterium]|nr:TraB/GumN family protein [Spirochaetales bacterium]